MGDYPDHTTLMQVIGSDVMIPIDIQAGYIMVPIDIQAQYVTLEIDIVAQTVGNIAIDIAAQTVGNLAVNIAASAVTLNMNLQSSSITLNVNVTNATINVAGSVSITGTPSVTISGTPTVTVSSGTVTISGTADVNIASSAITINVEVQNAYLYVRTEALQKLSIDIAAQSVGNLTIAINAADVTGNLPIDIKAQTVGNIGIDIKAATAKVGITINAADVTGNLAVDIKAQTVGNIGIDIKAQTLSQLNINIAASAVTINVEVQNAYLYIRTEVAQNLNVDIKAQTVGNINVDIAAQTVGNINVNLAASAITLTVNVSGTAQIDIEAQSVGVYLKAEWEVLQGTDKNEVGHASCPDDTETHVLDYTVTAGKTFYICQWGFGIANDSGVWASLYFYHNATPTHLALGGGRVGGSQSFTKPIAVVAGDHIKVGILQFSGASKEGYGFIGGYEI